MASQEVDRRPQPGIRRNARPGAPRGTDGPQLAATDREGPYRGATDCTSRGRRGLVKSLTSSIPVILNMFTKT